MSETKSQRRGPYPPVYYWTGFFLMIALHVLPSSPQIVHSPWKYLGLILIILGFGISIQLSTLFKRVDTTIKPFDESSVLVVESHYRYSRNPMYLWLSVTLLGLFVLLGSLLPLLIPPLFVLLINYNFIVQEEKDLAAKFGDSYSEYCRRVRRWL